MHEQEERARVVACARAWIGTPYHMNARIRGVGVDCGQLIIGVFADAGLVEAFDTGHSPIDFHLNRREERYVAFVAQRLTEFPGPGKPGDVVMFHFGHSYSHGAVIVASEPLTVVHALIRVGEVIEEVLTRHSEVLAQSTPGKPPRFFTRWPT